MSRSRRALFVIVALTFLASALAAWASQGAATPLDAWWYPIFVGQPAGLVPVAMWLGDATETIPMAIAFAALSLMFVVRGQSQRSLTALTTGLITAMAIEGVKAIGNRPRPLGELVVETNGSFPSGHVTSAAAFAVMLALLWPSVWARVMSACWIALIAWDRWSLGVHWFTDVLGGAALGTMIAIASNEGVRRLGQRRAKVDVAGTGPVA